MDSIKIQFIHTHSGTENTRGTWAQVARYLEHTVPGLYDLNNELASAALSLDLAGLMNVMNIEHPAGNIQFKYVHYERLKDHRNDCFRTKVSLKTDIYSVLDTPVSHASAVAFVGVEGESDRIRSYHAKLHGNVQYIISNPKSRAKAKRPLKLTG